MGRYHGCDRATWRRVFQRSYGLGLVGGTERGWACRMLAPSRHDGHADVVGVASMVLAGGQRTAARRSLVARSDERARLPLGI